jgi:hypothetical protein
MKSDDVVLLVVVLGWVLPILIPVIIAAIKIPFE